MRTENLEETYRGIAVTKALYTSKYIYTKGKQAVTFTGTFSFSVRLNDNKNDPEKLVDASLHIVPYAKKYCSIFWFVINY